MEYLNIAALACALIGAALNIFQAFFLREMSLLNILAAIPRALRYLFSDAFSPILEQLPPLGIEGIFLIGVIIIFLVLLIAVPYEAVTASIKAFQRREDSNYVSTLKYCCITMIIIAIIFYFVPTILNYLASDKLKHIDQFSRVYITAFFDVILSYEPPFIWAFFYGLAAFLADRDRKLWAVDQNEQDQPNKFNDENLNAASNETSHKDFNKQHNKIFSDENLEQAKKYYDQFTDKAGKVLKQSLDIGENLIKSSQTFIKDKLDSVRSNSTSQKISSHENLNDETINLNDAINIEAPTEDNETKYKHAVELKNTIELSYAQNRVRIQDYRKLFEILNELGDYKNSKDILKSTLVKLKNIRSKFSEERVKAKPELQKNVQVLDRLIAKYSAI